MDERAWDVVDRLVEWLDASSRLSPETERLLRLMKLSEEVGEVAQAVIGATGQNPPLTELSHSSAHVSDHVGCRSLAGSCMRMLSS